MIKPTNQKDQFDYNKGKMFFHCAHCLNKYNNSPERAKKTPREAMAYEISSYDYEYPDGHTESIVVVWCKKCTRMVWNTVHLTHRTSKAMESVDKDRLCQALDDILTWRKKAHTAPFKSHQKGDQRCRSLENGKASQ